jgi:TatD DNase family protein
MLIDCHAHLASRRFDADRDAVRRRARDAGVGAVLVVGEDLEDDRRVLRVCAEPCPGGAALLPCIGLHPDRYSEERSPPSRAEIDAIADLARRHRDELAAVGEVGLDRHWVRTDDRRAAQAALLEEMVALSRELDLPLNVHSRSAGHYTVDLLRAAGAERVLMHAFDGKAAHAARGADEGWVFSVPPSSIRSEQKKKLVRRLPLEALALESDSPVLGPVREERNEPMNLTHTVRLLAELHGVSEDRVAETTTATALRLFPALGSPVRGG